jgi:hypothetical protein
MAESQINEPGIDEDNNPHTPETQALDTALGRLIAIDKEFTQSHAIQVISEIKVSIHPHTTLLNHPLTNTDHMARPPQDRVHCIRSLQPGPSPPSSQSQRRNQMSSRLPSRLESPRCQFSELGCHGSGKADS